MVVEWREVALERVDAVGRCIRAAASEPAGLSLLTIIHRDCPVPTPEVRERIKTTIGGVAGALRAHATVIEGDGIGPITVRASINAMRVVLKKVYPEQSFATIDAAVPWLASQPEGARAAWMLSDVKALFPR